MRLGHYELRSVQKGSARDIHEYVGTSGPYDVAMKCTCGSTLGFCEMRAS
jgi:hypothetical protein